MIMNILIYKKKINSKNNIYFKSHPKQKFNYNVFKKKIYIGGYLNFEKFIKFTYLIQFLNLFLKLLKQT